MSRPKDVRGRWVAEIRSSSKIGDACRVLLMVMADDMTERGYVSVPREKLAKAIGRHPQRVTERIAEAITKGYLVRLQTGHRGRAGEKGMTSSYAASFPASGQIGNGRAVTYPRTDSAVGNGTAVTLDRLPIPDSEATCEAEKVTAERLANTRATEANRGTEPAPVGSGVSATDYMRNGGAYRDWQTTPSKRPSSVPKVGAA